MYYEKYIYEKKIKKKSKIGNLSWHVDGRGTDFGLVMQRADKARARTSQLKKRQDILIDSN